MAVVIAVAQQKGGAGKTMLAANLAAACALNGRRIAIMDIDPQRTLSRWHSIRADTQPRAAALTHSGLSGWRLGAELDRLARSHDVVLIDTPPQIDTDARIAIRGAGLVLVPVQPSPPDLWAAEGTLRLAREERRPALLVLNRAPAASKLRTAMEADIAAGGHRLAAAALGNRAGYAAAFAAGLGIIESSPRSVGAREFAALAEEIRQLVR